MELLDERPVWSMSGSELLSTLDALEAEAARRETYRLTVIAAIESTGYAAELGARDTAELLQFRYRQDAPVARRALRVAWALPKYHAVSSALDDDGSEWLLRPAQAEAIVSALERVPSHVPVADLDAAPTRPPTANTTRAPVRSVRLTRCLPLSTSPPQRPIPRNGRTLPREAPRLTWCQGSEPRRS